MKTLKNLIYGVLIFVGIICAAWSFGHSFGVGMAQGVIKAIQDEKGSK